MPKLLIVVNYDYAFLSHRKAIAQRAVKEGYNVTVLAKDTGKSKEISDMGVEFVPMPGCPTGMNPVEELKTLMFLIDFYKKTRPDVVHHVVLKNVMWGSIAARMTRVPGVLNAVCGLGVMFKMPLGNKARLILKLIRFGSRRRNLLTLFQNSEDRSLFREAGIVNDNTCVFTKGSGVDLEEFSYRVPKDGDRIVIVFSGRMVEEKGVKVLVKSAEILREKYEGRIEFRLYGPLSSNPRAITREWLLDHCDGDYIKWIGDCDCDDMQTALAESHIMAFPSSYREGVPKAVIEACAIGRPIVTTDSVGCRDTVDEGINGYLIPVDNPELLADRLERLITDRGLRLRMGKASRRKAEAEFNVDNVVDVHMDTYRKLIQNCKK